LPRKTYLRLLKHENNQTNKQNMIIVQVKEGELIERRRKHRTRTQKIQKKI